jgi:UDP-N-acetylmuramoyl-L-alanyl-D-glutamate--2,6-diaminopimelate ligase
VQEQRTIRRLDDLARAAGDLLVASEGASDDAVTGLSYDSRRTRRGDLFFCVVGARADGHTFASKAVAAGAVGLVVERPLDLPVPQVVVRDVRRAMARIAAAFHGHPSDDLLLLGITGTNGKTTTAYLLESILSAWGRTTGLIGTIETRVGKASRPGVRTTPESVDLHALLAEMRDEGVDAVAMEVTSHALALHRIESVRFEVAAFTNLSRDHLDFHRDMEDYFQAKRSLFVPERVGAACANVDDPHGRKIVEDAAVPTIGFGISDDADVRAHDVRMGPWGTEFVISLSGGVPAGDVKISTALVGAFNVSNILAATATAALANIDMAAIEAGVTALRAVPGRFEAVDCGQPFTVVVDYAHTPDSLENALREARRIAQSSDGRVICAFGCGGDRDAAKRPLMGAVAASHADVVVVTSDNPRSEKPLSIIDQILEGLVAERGGVPDAVLVDRREAITEVLSLARLGDVVVVAGKGHETGQEFAGFTVPFDDRLVAGEVLTELGYSRGGRR